MTISSIITIVIMKESSDGWNRLIIMLMTVDSKTAITKEPVTDSPPKMGIKRGGFHLTK